LARRQAQAAEAQATGAQQTLATAEENLSAVTELRQARDAAQGQLDTARASRDRATSALTTARADFQRAESLFQQGAVARRDYDNARLALDTAQAALDTANAQVQTAQDTLAHATKALNDRLAARQGVISAQTARRSTARQREAAQAQVRQVAAQLAGAKEQLQNARTAYQDRLQVRTARDTAATAVRATAAQVEAARQQLALLEAGNTEAVIAAARGQLKAAQGAVDLAKDRLSDTVVRAPRAGTISTVVLRAGEMAAAGLPIVKMQDLKNAYVRVYLPFRSFGKVRIGDPATITTDALPKRSFQGVIREMATEAEFTPKNVETRDQRLQQVYWVKVAIKDPDGRLKPGMPARATVNGR
jgi:HlyD family secretion protein